MPNITDLTITKNDETTYIAYLAQQPSSGDGTPAIWRANVGSAPIHAPEFRLSSREAEKGAKRVLRMTYRYPQLVTNSTTGVTSVAGYIDWDATLRFSRSIPQADINEAVTQFPRLLTHDATRAVLKSGYSAT